MQGQPRSSKAPYQNQTASNPPGHSLQKRNSPAYAQNYLHEATENGKAQNICECMKVRIKVDTQNVCCYC